METIDRGRTVAVAAGEEIGTVVEDLARELGGSDGGTDGGTDGRPTRLRFLARSGWLEHALVGFDDLSACCYRQVTGEDLEIVSLDGEVRSPRDAAMRASAVLRDRDGLHLSGRLLGARAGREGLELLVLGDPE